MKAQMLSMKRFSLFSTALVASALMVAPAHASVDSISAETSGKLSDTRISVVVTGTVVCSDGNEVEVAANVVQTSGGTNTVAAGSTMIVCTGQVQTWSLSADILVGAAFKNGPATMLFAGFDVTDGTGSEIHVQPIKLKK